MYTISFKAEKREPKRLYFSARNRDTKHIEFKAENKEPIKFRINSNFKMSVE